MRNRITIYECIHKLTPLTKDDLDTIIFNGWINMPFLEEPRQQYMYMFKKSIPVLQTYIPIKSLLN